MLVRSDAGVRYAPLEVRNSMVFELLFEFELELLFEFELLLKLKFQVPLEPESPAEQANAGVADAKA